ncbi:hypothetical protein SAMN05660199_03892 [Klenkia soli]|uniref:Uncharacterized protein n=1 Tax=Klenkia soli TaxID=1052260 RepID=A0A1H0SLM5_9ACTN|nr:hypothetical protein [Klenkia soli]SDP42651.1 hypothetical protein SAMN05660199_03892 [Klenkia soli]
MTAFGSARSTPTSTSADTRPRAEVIPIGGRTGLPVSLAEAAAAAPVSDRLLWVEYLTLGGTGDLEWFRAHLRSTEPGDARTQAEHAVVVAMFTELFTDEGIALRVV